MRGLNEHTTIAHTTPQLICENIQTDCKCESGATRWFSAISVFLNLIWLQYVLISFCKTSGYFEFAAIKKNALSKYAYYLNAVSTAHSTHTYMENKIMGNFLYKFNQYKHADGAEDLIIFLFMSMVTWWSVWLCVRVCVHTGVDLSVSLQGFLCLELGATLVTNYGLLTSWKTREESGRLLHNHTDVPYMEAVWNGEKKRLS